MGRLVPAPLGFRTLRAGRSPWPLRVTQPGTFSKRSSNRAIRSWEFSINPRVDRAVATIVPVSSDRFANAQARPGQLEASCRRAREELSVWSQLDPDGTRVPAAEAPLMRDIEFAMRAMPSAQPAIQCRILVQLLLHHSTDHLESTLDLLEAGERPVYAIATLTRGACESSSRAYHLAQAGLAPKVRAARIINEQIENLRSIERLPPAERQGLVFPQVYREVERMAAEGGLTLVVGDGQPDHKAELRDGRWYEEPRPSNSRLINQWMAWGDGPRREGRPYHAFSGAAHGMQAALAARMLPYENESSNPLGFHPAVRVAPDSLLTDSQVSYATILHSMAIAAFAEWNGWELPASYSERSLEWSEAAHRDTDEHYDPETGFPRLDLD